MLIRQKKIRFGGFEFGVRADPGRADQIRESKLYRYVLRPGMRLADREQREAVEARPTASPAPEMPPTDPAARRLWERVRQIGWYHTIDLGHGVVTPGFIDNRATVPLFGLPEDLTGRRCLDVGTYDGFWAFEMERRGASEVIGIDVDSPLDHDMPRLQRLAAIAASGAQSDVHRQHWTDQQAERGLEYPGAGFELARETLGSRVRRENLSVYDLSPERFGMFDLVLISQLLLRLRDPQTVIENMFSVAREIAIVAEPYAVELEESGRPLSEFVGTSVLGVWWRHSIRSMRKMMEIAGFNPVEEVSRFEVGNRSGRFSKVVLRGRVPEGAR